MKLHEYHSKQIFSKYGIPIPRGRVALSAGEARQITEELGVSVVIKSQVLTGGRGKAGGIRLAKNPREAEELATAILGMEIKGLPVRKVLVDEAVTFEREIYLGIANDQSKKLPVLLASSAGGMDIETVAVNEPEKIARVWINPLIGLRDYQVREVASGIDLPTRLWKQFTELCRAIWNIYRDYDASLSEINPLVITDDGKLMALDAKINIDDNALFRHPDLNELRDLDAEDPLEEEARKYELAYVRMTGNIGCMVNGAGLAMAVNDQITYLGGEPANFLDIGGGASAEKVSAAMRILLSDPGVKVVLINIFGGITRCDEVAKGILTSLAEMDNTTPIITRLIGMNADEGKAMLALPQISHFETLEDACQAAVESTRGNL